MTPTSTDRRQSVRVLSPLRDFLHTESAGAVLLAAGAIIALLWVNSPWSESYTTLWETELNLAIGEHALHLDLRHAVNDGLMAVFFLIVGLEIKRELTSGHLSTRRAALLPAAAAIGGMAIPALLYLAIAGGSAPKGWAIPMATDIALAIGILSVAGDRVAPSLRAFLLGLAIVDDIGAILVIALFYSSGVSLISLGVAAAGLVATIIVRRARVNAIWVYVVLGAIIWLGLHEAGIHPTIAGVAMGLLAPSTPSVRPELVDVDDLLDLSDVNRAFESSQIARSSVSVVEWLQHILHPWTSFVIVPIFALANSGIELSGSGIADALGSPITWGVFVGLFVGKPVGIFLATRVTVRSGLADPPSGSSSNQLLGIGSAAGIGFTVSLFVAELAFDDVADIDSAKLAILVASVLAAASSAVLLRRSSPVPA